MRGLLLIDILKAEYNSKRIKYLLEFREGIIQKLNNAVSGGLEWTAVYVGDDTSLCYEDVLSIKEWLESEGLIVLEEGEHLRISGWKL